VAQTQTLLPIGAGGVGSGTKLKFAIVRINNSAGETSYTLTAASIGMAEFAAVALDETAANAIRANPTAGSGGLYTQVAFTFTGGDELTLLCIGQ